MVSSGHIVILINIKDGADFLDSPIRFFINTKNRLPAIKNIMANNP
jgi:hypothetical protein